MPRISLETREEFKVQQDSVVHVQRDGTILVDGEAVGFVFKLDVAGPGKTKWRAEVGDVSRPETYRASYARTRKAAVADVLEARS